MATTQVVETITAQAAGDLSSSQFLLGQINGSGQVAVVGTQGVRVDGVIMNKPTAQGQACELAVGGMPKCIFGAAVTPGAEVMSNAAGKAITATATNYVFGVYMGKAAAANNDLGPVLIDKYKI